MILRKAEVKDTDAVLRLYRAHIGTQYCTWDEYYPGEDTVSEDLAHGNLYVTEEDGQIIGAASIISENELNTLGFWTPAENAREIARVVTAHDQQNRGVGMFTVLGIMDRLFADGAESIRLLVAVKNLPAQRLYEKCGLAKVGRTFMYEHDYDAMEALAPDR